MHNDKIIRALSELKSIKSNLPDYHSVEEHWVNQYHSAIIKIEDASNLDLSEYKVPQNMVAKEVTSWSPSGGENYSEENYCERSVLLQKIDSTLNYISGLNFNSQSDSASNEKNKSLTKVFIVHGHNDAVKESIARFIEKLGLIPIILHEQPNKGRTIIEKFIDYSEVGFAVVLLTADDIGGVKSAPENKQKLRARQNVIFELGYFIGQLGRDRVCALYEDGVELPSDYQGVIFESLDAKGNWKFAVAKELKEVGFNVDLNKIL
jgi:predicted nucleotide-binding protein